MDIFFVGLSFSLKIRHIIALAKGNSLYLHFAQLSQIQPYVTVRRSSTISTLHDVSKNCFLVASSDSENYT